ncbi:putative tocopherol C-methyltransferase [Helianthus annuus]|nr:putative tocopherol C-methyltransferase [Helianthus annuus]
MWENIWGENMHHGYYNSDDVVELSDHRSAQIRMIEQALTFASVSGLLRYKWSDMEQKRVEANKLASEKKTKFKSEFKRIVSYTATKVLTVNFF